MINYYCDLVYSREGHMDQDFEKLNNWCDNKLEHIIGKETSFLGYIKEAYKTLKLQGNVTFASVHYIPLYIASLFANNWNYSLVIHFFPSIHEKIYKYIIGKFIKKCKTIIVLDESVRDYLIKKTSVNLPEKFKILHTRDVIKLDKTNKEKEKKIILVIGSLNQMKDLRPLLNVINNYEFSNLYFKFVCHGIDNYLEINHFEKVCKSNTVLFEDRFPSLEEYKQLIYDADYVYIAYSKNYGVRYSGILFDSLAQGTLIISNSNPSLTRALNSYKCGYIFSNEYELADILLSINNCENTKLIISDDLYKDWSFLRNKQLACAALLN